MQPFWQDVVFIHLIARLKGATQDKYKNLY